MWNRKRIHFGFIANGIFKNTAQFRFKEYGPVNVDTHQQNLKNLFPDVYIDAL